MNLWKSIKLAWRRRKLQASPPPCPCCGGVQVQLVDWLKEPALWGCRLCKVSWWRETADGLPVAYGHPQPPDYAVREQGRWSPETWEKVLHPDKHE